MEPITSTSMLINFEGTKMTPDQKQYHNQVYSAIRVQLQQMSKYEQIDKFTSCSKCHMVLTKQDKELVFYWQEIDMNRESFKVQQLKKIQSDPHNYVIWICRFCNKKNIIQKNNLYFAQNKCRVIQRPATKDAKKEPIILIVFDTSGSMQQVILDQKQDSNKGDKPDSKMSKFKQQLKNTQIYKKIVAQEQKILKQFIQNQKINSRQYLKPSFQDHLKKNKLLMSLTQLAIEKLSKGKQKPQQMINFGGNVNKNKEKSKPPKSKTIGFIFFNSFVYLQLDGKKVVTVYDQNDVCKSQNKVKTDFESFNKLYEVGQNYGLQYSTSLSNFKFTDLDLSVKNPQGQTALGPAIMISLGIISKHGPGSSIFVVTDGKANKGIFQQTTKWQQQYSFLKMKLQKFKGFLAILQWKDISTQLPQIKQKQYKYNKATTLDSFCKIYQNSIAQKINILFNQSCNENMIQGVQNKVQSCVNRQNVCWVNNVSIKCQNTNITYEDSVKSLNDKSIDFYKLYHINPKFQEKKFKERDYAYPFMTQILIKYQNTQTHQQSVFMAYIIQKLVKFQSMRKKQKNSLDNQKTLTNLMGYLAAQDFLYSIENLSMTVVQKTFRQTIGQKTLRFTISQNDYSNQQYQNGDQFGVKKKIGFLGQNQRVKGNKDKNKVQKQEPVPFLSSLCQYKPEDHQINQDQENDIVRI